MKLSAFFFVLMCALTWAYAGGDAEAQSAIKASPWLDLKSGGIAYGHPQGGLFKGRLYNGSLLPERGPGFRRLGGESINFGTGHMISLLEHAAAALQQDFPGTVLNIGGISRETGGNFPPHKSHQNGLDADIGFAGIQGFESVVAPDGTINEKFDVAKNWALWRMLTDQRYDENGQTLSVVSMILVAPEVKDHLCRWAVANEILKDSLNVEVMRKIRPTPGHHTHFHLRIRCSPYHLECDRQMSSPKAARAESDPCT